MYKNAVIDGCRTEGYMWVGWVGRKSLGGFTKSTFRANNFLCNNSMIYIKLQTKHEEFIITKSNKKIGHVTFVIVGY